MMMAVVFRLLAVLLCVLTVSGSQPPVVREMELRDVRVEKTGMTIQLPADAYVTGRSVSPDYEPLKQLGMTASQLEVEFRKGDIYCAAVWFPESTDMTEILVTVKEDDDSRAIFHLADYDQLYLTALADSYAAFSQQGLSVSARYTSAEVKRCGQAVYIKAHGVMDAQEASENHLHYMTVINGMRVEITLVEHYSQQGIPAQTQRVTADNEQMMDTIIESLRYDKLENEFMAKNKDFVVYAVLIVAASIGLIVAYIVSKVRAQGTEPFAPTEPYAAEEEKPDTDEREEESPDDI